MKILKILKKSFEKSSKGMEIVTAIIICAIVSLSTISMLLPSLDTMRVIQKIVEYEYNYDNSQLALVALLSDREAYQKLSYYVAGLPNVAGIFDREGTKSLLKSKLDKLVESKCYNISSSKEVIIESSVAGKPCNPGYAATAFIALPYGKDFGKIELKTG